MHKKALLVLSPFVASGLFLAVTALPASASVTAANHSYSVEAGTTLNVSAPGLLAGATDSDGGTATLESSFFFANHGTASANTDGSFSFTADQGYTGPDSFTYQVCDSNSVLDCSTGTVSMSIIGSAPSVQSQSYTAKPGTTLIVSAPGVLSGASGYNGESFTASVVSQPSNGYVTMSNDGGFNYSAPYDFIGSESFTYDACGNTTGLCSAATNVTVNVTASTPTVATQSYVTKPKEPLSEGAPGLLEGSAGPSGDTLQAEIVSYPTSGTVTVDNDGAFIYTPDQFTNFLGIDSFTYKACDTTTGLCSGAANVNVKVGIQPAIHGSSLLRLLRRRSFTKVFSVTGDPVPKLVMRGHLPAGVRAVHRNKTTYVISGTPTGVGTSLLTFTATNGVSPSARLVFHLIVQLHPAKAKKTKHG